MGATVDFASSIHCGRLLKLQQTAGGSGNWSLRYSEFALSWQLPAVDKDMEWKLRNGPEQTAFQVIIMALDEVVISRGPRTRLIGGRLTAVKSLPLVF